MMDNADVSRESLWRESIALFRSAYLGDHLAGRVVLDAVPDTRRLTEFLLLLLQVHLIDVDEVSMTRFLSIAEATGPPPRYGSRPLPTVRALPTSPGREAS